MSIKQRLTEKQQRNINQIIPLMVEKINRAGGILPIDDLIRTYNTIVIDQAVAKKLITVIIVGARDTNNERPVRQIKAAHTPEWSGDKPIWLV